MIRKISTITIISALSAGAVYYQHSKHLAESIPDRFMMPDPVQTGALDPLSAGSFTVIGTGVENDPCTVKIHSETLPKMEELGIRRWVDVCNEKIESR